MMKKVSSTSCSSPKLRQLVPCWGLTLIGFYYDKNAKIVSNKDPVNSLDGQ